MISQEHLTQYLTNTNFKKIVLPYSDKVTQQDYYSIKKREMDMTINQLKNIDQLTNIGPVINNFQDDLNHKYRTLMKSSANDTSTVKEGTTDLTKAKRVDYETYLSYNENEMIPVPTFISNILTGPKSTGNILLYGNKNPESYFKSLLVLGSPDFMIKSKYERIADICKIKKEIAFAVNNLFHNNKYNLLGNGNAGRLGFNKDKMIKNLLNQENYTDMSIFQVSIDFMKKNLIIFDIAKKNFQLFVHGPFDKLLIGTLDLVSHLRSLDWHMIIMYNNAYLPIFCVDTHHLFKGEHIINKLMTEYEWLNPELYVNVKCNITQDIQQFDNHPTESIMSEPCYTSSAEPNITIPTQNNSVNTELQTSPVAMQTFTLSDLKPCKNYLLSDLQNLAEAFKLSIKKQSTTGAFKNKTKQELYDELVTKLTGSNP